MSYCIGFNDRSVDYCQLIIAIDCVDDVTSTTIGFAYIHKAARLHGLRVRSFQGLHRSAPFSTAGHEAGPVLATLRRLTTGTLWESSDIPDRPGDLL